MCISKNCILQEVFHSWRSSHVRGHISLYPSIRPSSWYVNSDLQQLNSWSNFTLIQDAESKPGMDQNSVCTVSAPPGVIHLSLHTISTLFHSLCPVQALPPIPCASLPASIMVMMAHWPSCKWVAYGLAIM